MVPPLRKAATVALGENEPLARLQDEVAGGHGPRLLWLQELRGAVELDGEGA
jgi:hypothetical protein